MTERNAGERESAFTLVELLVVIAIISVLAAMLLPALEEARRAALGVRCIGNLGQIGMAFMMYCDDYGGSFPVHANWSTAYGKLGHSAYFSSNAYGEADRPLNTYLGDPAVCECPADLGDPRRTETETCMYLYGTSYLVQWGSDYYRVKHVTSDGVSSDPLRVTALSASPTTKIVCGDWVWHGNRPLSDARTLWHSRGDERRFCMSFADGHAELFVFPIAIEGWQNAPVDPEIGFW